MASYLITFVGADKRLVPNVLHCCALFGTEPQGGCGHVEYPTGPAVWYRVAVLDGEFVVGSAAGTSR